MSGVICTLLRRNYSQLTLISSRKSRVSMMLLSCSSAACDAYANARGIGLRAVMLNAGRRTCSRTLQIRADVHGIAVATAIQNTPVYRNTPVHGDTPWYGIFTLIFLCFFGWCYLQSARTAIWCIPRLFAVRTAIFCFIHQMAIHIATKFLPLRSQTKLTLTVTLTLTDTETNIFYAHFVDSHKKGVTAFMKGIFHGRCPAGSVGGAIFCTTQQLHSLSVCWCSCTQLRKHQRQEIDSSYFIIRRGLLWGICKK